MSFPCYHCKKILSSKRNLENHLEKKVCLKNKKICEKCGYEFKTLAMLKYHLDHLVCQNLSEKKIVLKKVIDLDDLNKQDLYEENLRLKGQIEALKENPQTINNTVNNIDKQQINVFFPQAFGTEEFNHILSKIWYLT
jgi:hypothetical protein